MKKLPIRKCIACMQSKPKKELYRIIKDDDTVKIDFSGKTNGRGTYICSMQCLQKAIKTKAIERELSIKINQETYNQLISQLNDYSK